MLKLILT